MLAESQLQEAGGLVEWLRLQVHERELPASNRVRAAASCLGIAQEHHHAIVLLLERTLYASAFALMRVEFEAYVRGVWLMLCATDDKVGRFLNGDEPPKIDALLSELEATPGFAEKVLSGLKQKHWRAMCGYTHTGGIHVQRWNTPDGVEPNYSIDEVREVLYFAGIIGCLSVLGFAHMAKDDALAVRLLERVQALAK
jgi:hypothetical protein